MKVLFIISTSLVLVGTINSMRAPLHAIPENIIEEYEHKEVIPK